MEVPVGAVTADVGIFGGSGFYELLGGARAHAVDTPYGPPSSAVVVGQVGERRVAFLARHGPDHTIPPHRIEFRANLWAMASFGVRAIVSPFACGSLRPDRRPGELVVVDQLIDRTKARADTFHDGPDVAHVGFADPYDSGLGEHVAAAAERLGQAVHRGGTVAVIEGPRFSTRAESRGLRAMGADLVNMTQYPEAVLAAELSIPFAGVGLVTDYDAGLEGDEGIAPVSMEEVFAVLAANADRVREILFEAIPTLPLPPLAS